MKEAPAEWEEWSRVLYGVWRDLPVGAVFLDSRGNVLFLNRRMRSLFPPRSDFPPLGGLLRCPFARNGPCGRSRECESCALWKGVRGIVRDGGPMPESELRHVEYRKGRRRVRWFAVSGTPVSYCGEPYAVLFFNDVTERARRERMLEKKLELDRPTGVLNKVSLIRSLDSLLRAEDREPFTLCMIDFDDFKTINDRYGHLTGDRVLSAFCGAARRNLRPGDVLGRYGGDEFLFVFKGGPERAEGILERVRSELRDSLAEVLPAPVTFSAGIVRFGGSADPRTDWRELIRTADDLLYRAKGSGG